MSIHIFTNRPFTGEIASFDSTYYWQLNKYAKLTHPGKKLSILNQGCNFHILRDLECLTHVKYSLFHHRKLNFLQFGLGGAVKQMEEEDDRMNEIVHHL